MATTQAHWTIVEERRRQATARLDSGQRAQLGQYFTPAPVATFMASLPALPAAGLVRVLDPGAGVGSLLAALVERIVSERPDLDLSITAVEVDPRLIPELASTLEDCQALARISGTCLTTRIVEADFLRWAGPTLEITDTVQEPQRFDIVIMNPPYRKIRADEGIHELLVPLGVRTTNLYAAFVAVSVSRLSEGGQIAAITPRSFTNGPYFRAFRRYLFDRIYLDWVHLFGSRTRAFADDAVLQENVIFCGHLKGPGEAEPAVTVSTSDGPGDPLGERHIPHAEIVQLSDPERFVHIAADAADAAVSALLAGLPARAGDLGVEVSTGRVVTFRARPFLRMEPMPGNVPLVNAGHLVEGRVVWPDERRRKANWIADVEGTRPLLLPAETFVLIKRFTSKEERRRVVAAVFSPTACDAAVVAFENHLNVVHIGGRGLDEEFARGLAVWLNSTVVDRYVRCFNGHTQINATDLRGLAFPAKDQICALGLAAADLAVYEQGAIDDIVETYVFGSGATAS